MRRPEVTPRRALLAVCMVILLTAVGAVLILRMDQPPSYNFPDRETSLGVTGLIRGITSRSREIYQSGLDKGNLPHAFTVIGDSITVDSRFLRPFAAGNYDLGVYETLADTVAYFSGPDGRGANPYSVPTLAAQVGWMTESVLNPALADPVQCTSDESPLVCELRSARPAVAIIMLGTNDLAGGRSLATYQTNLRQIVEITISHGTIPLLSTIPPLPISAAHNARVAEFNAVIHQTAQDFDVPLMDYWTALQTVPAFGISADGVHPNAPPDGMSAVFNREHLAYGYTIRNWLTLDALDQIIRYALNP